MRVSFAGRVRPASPETVRFWRKRQFGTALPFAVLVLLAALSPGLHRSPALVALLLIPLGLFYLLLGVGALLHLYRLRHTPAGFRFVISGQLGLEEIQACALFATYLWSLDPGPVINSTRGWIPGRLSFANDLMVFQPGPIAWRSHIPELTLLWQEVDRVEFVRAVVPATPISAIQMFLRDGSTFGSLFRAGGLRAAAALVLTELGQE